MSTPYDKHSRWRTHWEDSYIVLVDKIPVSAGFLDAPALNGCRIRRKSSRVHLRFATAMNQHGPIVAWSKVLHNEVGGLKEEWNRSVLHRGLTTGTFVSFIRVQLSYVTRHIVCDERGFKLEEAEMKQGKYLVAGFEAPSSPSHRRMHVELSIQYMDRSTATEKSERRTELSPEKMESRAAGWPYVGTFAEAIQSKGVEYCLRTTRMVGLISSCWLCLSTRALASWHIACLISSVLARKK